MDNEKEIRNIFQEYELVDMVFNKYKRERMIELCGEDWVNSHESDLHLNSKSGGNLNEL